MNISSTAAASATLAASRPVQSAPAPAPAVNDHDADDQPGGATTAAPVQRAPAPAGTGLSIDKLA